MNSPCEKMRERIADYVIGILADDEIQAVEQHINQCSECKEYANSLMSEKEQLLQLIENQNEQMQGREAKVIDALNELTIEKKKRITIGRIISRLAAAIILILIMCWFLINYDNNKQQDSNIIVSSENNTASEVVSIITLNRAFRDGGIDAVEKQFEKAEKKAVPSLKKNITIDQLIYELEQSEEI